MTYAALTLEQPRMEPTPELYAGLGTAIMALGGLAGRWLTLRHERQKDVTATLHGLLGEVRTQLNRERDDRRTDQKAMQDRLDVLDLEYNALWRAKGAVDTELAEVRGENRVLQCERDKAVITTARLEAEILSNRQTITALTAKVSELEVQMANHHNG